MTYDLVEEVGGSERLEAMLREFYDALYDDILVGFLFQPHDKEKLILSQYDYVYAHLGNRAGDYTGPSIRRAHGHVPILPGHFDRRHKLLMDLLERWEVPDHVREDWLKLDRSLRKFVVHLGASERDRILAE